MNVSTRRGEGCWVSREAAVAAEAAEAAEAAAEKNIRKRQRKEAAGAALVLGYPFLNFSP